MRLAIRLNTHGLSDTFSLLQARLQSTEYFEYQCNQYLHINVVYGKSKCGEVLLKQNKLPAVL